VDKLTFLQASGAGGRYVFDFDLCASDKGWAQFDTGQDASYFGIWGNPFTFELVTYAEGDVGHTKLDSEIGFRHEVHKLKAFYDQTGWMFLGIDPGFNEELRQRFVEIGLGDLLH